MTRAIGRALWPALGAATALYVGWGLVPGHPFYAGLLTPPRLLGIASVLKLALLALGVAWTLACRRALGADNPVRPAWTLLAAGLGSTLLGQACLAPAQLLRATTPFPSVADVFYVLSYPLFGAAFVKFIGAYQSSGLPLGSRRESLVILGVTVAACLAVGILVLRPVIAAPMPVLDKALSAAYPALDLALLVPLAVLLRTTLHLRGGHVGAAWFTVLAGFLFLCGADVLFAYFTALGRTGFDPFVHASYVVSYGLIAAGVGRHVAALTA